MLRLLLMGEKNIERTGSHGGGKEYRERRYQSWAYLLFVVLDALLVLAVVDVIYG